ncbi:MULTISPECIES: Rha family transcriptional regulator [Providencia]|uniref:Rha family transcriptional regulator n=1 Tax=Providencia TaxID=586 RepID=UPI0021D50BBB|nr:MULTISPECIES: Rha family transcriptional regulator [Providencia]WIE07330.1 Rha family transcriptional regulator [Providencia rettgeri]
MNELTLASNETNVTMSSREIAELTGKAHHHVVRDIEKMLSELDFNYPNTDNYVSKEFFIKRKKYKGRSVIDEIGLDQDLTMTLMTGYSVPLRHKVSRRWRELETGKVTPMAALNDPEFLRSTLLTYSEKVIALEHSNKELSNKVECMSNLFKEGMTPTQFCKMLNGVNTQQVQMWLAERNWLYNESKSGKNVRWRVASYARDKYMTENQSEINPHGYEPFIKYQPVLLKKGAKRIYDLYLAGELPMKKNWDGLFTHDKELKAAA